MKVIGIDPGTHVAGYGIVETDARNASARTLVTCGVFRAARNQPESRRLLTIFEGLEKILTEHRPEVACMEDVFAGRNARTALTIGEGRGVALVALARAGIEVHALPPAEIKKALTGNGRADKLQVQRMVQLLLDLEELPQPHDAADALAAALCLCNRL